MIIQVTCSHCKELKWMRGKFYKINLTKFNVGSLEELNQKYLCATCRKHLKKHYYVSELKSTYKYRKVQSLLQEEVDLYQRRGLTNIDARNNFILNVKNILDKFYIKNYSYVSKDNKLIGIEVLDKIPFFGSVTIELESE